MDDALNLTPLFFSYQEITDFRYFRNIISRLISHVFVDVIMFEGFLQESYTIQL